MPAPGSSPAPAPAAPPAEPDNDATRIVAVGSEAAPTWRLTLPSGETVVVDGALFLGRNPTRAEGDLAGALLPLADETKSVSKTHALLTVDAEGLWVTDLDSTNGVYVALPEGDGEQAEPGERLRVPAGSDIVLGEFVIQVERG